MTRTHPEGALTGPRGPVAVQVGWATSPMRRMRGVLGRPALGPYEALVIAPCRRVHSFGVGYPLDVVFCDDELHVLHVETLAPRKISRRVGAAALCIELAAGRSRACGIAPGVRLSFEGAR